MTNIINQFNTWANQLNISSNSGVFLLILGVAVLCVIVFFIMTLAFSSKKRKLASKNIEQDAVLNAMYEVLPDMVVCKDNADRFIKCNDSFARFAGTDEAQLLGKSLTDMLEITKRMPTAEIVAADRKALAEGMKIKTPPLPMQFPDGSKRFFESVRTPLLRKKGGTMGILCVFRESDTADSRGQSPETAASSEAVARKDAEIAALKAELLAVRKAALCNNALRYIAAMGAALSGGDYLDYATHMASVRIETAAIGAQKLSERAHLLEDAVARDDTDYIKTNHPEFISSLSALLGELDAQARKA
jgi:PAS domain S-box-containing protein